MTPLIAVVGLLGVVATAVSGVVIVMLKNSRNSPETRDVQTKGWDLLTGNLTKEVERVTSEQQKMREQMSLLRQEVSDKSVEVSTQTERLDSQQKQINKLTVKVSALEIVVTWSRVRIAQLVEWGRSGIGGEPPVPATPEPVIEEG